MHNSSTIFSDMIHQTAERLADVKKRPCDIDHISPTSPSAVSNNRAALIATTALLHALPVGLLLPDNVRR
ncbi:hypothetical protein BKA03_002820 [Demequina lutea]|uniref:Uncharacterized protein n=1 Tax=Demequina lutea TaxID=431489 RepID=A0A7Y9ZG17_9MICO|nr:hypothetical protein [Demequina lutea]